MLCSLFVLKDAPNAQDTSTAGSRAGKMDRDPGDTRKEIGGHSLPVVGRGLAFEADTSRFRGKRGKENFFPNRFRRNPLKSHVSRKETEGRFDRFSRSIEARATSVGADLKGNESTMKPRDRMRSP
jgi:hypothetical protein